MPLTTTGSIELNTVIREAANYEDFLQRLKKFD